MQLYLYLHRRAQQSVFLSTCASRKPLYESRPNFIASCISTISPGLLSLSLKILNFQNFCDFFKKFSLTFDCVTVKMPKCPLLSRSFQLIATKLHDNDGSDGRIQATGTTFLSVCKILKLLGHFKFFLTCNTGPYGTGNFKTLVLLLLQLSSQFSQTS